MENFQLYRTNLFLGGQMKLDLILDSNNNELSVSDIHLRPISNNMLYSYTENLLNDRHQDNIKKYYNSIKDKFYDELLDAEFMHNWPLESSDNDIVNYCNDYDMGCKRMKYYHYNKQFEFFCPLWIEHANKSIEFEINISPVNLNTSFAKKSLKIDLEIPENKFDEYLSDYFTSAKLTEGDDNIISIDFESKTANVTGLNVHSGVFCKTDISDIVNVITDVERPLMETDNIIIKTFKDYSMIAKQLINFNLCFNIEDVITKEVTNLIKGNLFNVFINVYIDGKKLDIKDFYTNYEFIDRSIENKSDIKLNVFDYLHDNEYIEIIDKNKYTQNICHWSLTEDPSYIFNLYEGFSGITVKENLDSIEEDKYIYIINEHYYRNTPNTTAINVSDKNNAASWINTYTIDSWSELQNFITKEKYKKEKSTVINKNTKYINGLRYDNIYVDDTDPIYILSICISNKFYKILKSAYKTFEMKTINISNDIKIYYKDDYYIICTPYINRLAYNTFSNVILNYENDDLSIIKTLKSMFSSKVDPATIVINNTLNYINTAGPTKNVNEVTYVKNSDNINNFVYLFRYDGKIKPSFIDSGQKDHNILYYKDTVENINNSKYSVYLKTGYEPIYPSIDYCSIIKLDDWTYDNKPEIINEHNVEYSWFNNNTCLLLSSKITFNFSSDSVDFDEIINNQIIEVIKNEYYCNNDMAKYISNFYEKYIYWEYELENNINAYNYFITLRLK